MARWHFDPRDTEQQRYVLRTSKTAQHVREMYPVGTTVSYPPGVFKDPPKATVLRHVPMTNAQGGYLRVRWDSGLEGQLSPINAYIVKDEDNA